MSRATAKIPGLAPAETSLSPPAALLQREDRGYNSTEHVDKAIRKLKKLSLCCFASHEDYHPGTGPRFSLRKAQVL